jgi:signal transduction histidine kinase
MTNSPEVKCRSSDYSADRNLPKSHFDSEQIRLRPNSSLPSGKARACGTSELSRWYRKSLEPTDLNEAAREVIALLLSELQRNGAILQHEYADRLPIVQGDRIQLQQVILNLVRNASDAMRDIEDRPRRLLTRTEQVDENVCVTVQDFGIGFSNRSTRQRRSIIEAHGGRLWAAANDGPRATFAFSVPRGYAT